jgi:hypothetical protein
MRFPSGLVEVRGAVTNQSEAGQSLVKYAFILVLIALIVVVMLVTYWRANPEHVLRHNYTRHNHAGI